MAATALRQDEARIWTVDATHAPGFWFPRQCPRACCWLREDQRANAAPGFLNLGARSRMHAIQSDWLDKMRACELFAYTFDPAHFRLEDAEAGHWIAREAVTPLAVEPVGDLIARHAREQIELRVVSDLRSLIEQIMTSGLSFSIYRRHNLVAPQQTKSPHGGQP